MKVYLYGRVLKKVLPIFDELFKLYSLENSETHGGFGRRAFTLRTLLGFHEL